MKTIESYMPKFVINKVEGNGFVIIGVRVVEMEPLKVTWDYSC
jgi:hypothetical protein